MQLIDHRERKSLQERRDSSRSRGFTLIELVAALGLSTLLLLSLVVMLRQMIEVQRRSDLRSLKPRLSARLCANLETDYFSCRQILVTQESVVFEGFGGRSSQRGHCQGLPSRTEYFVRPGEEAWLVRDRKTWDATDQVREDRHRLVRGVKSLRVETPSGSSHQWLSITGSGRRSIPAPEVLRLTVEFNDGSQQSVVLLRQGDS